MNLNEAHVLSEALTQFIENSNDIEPSRRELYDLAIAERMLDDINERIVNTLEADGRALRVLEAA